MADTETSIRQAISAACEEIAGNTPQLDAEILLAHTLEKPRSHLLAWPEKRLTHEQLSLFQSYVQRRKTGTPIAYIIKVREFWSLPFRINPNVLIPRPETELLVETALSTLPIKPLDVLDLGTGSGAIAIALASERPQWRVVASDLSDDAIAIARENAARLGVKVQFLCSNWLDSLGDGQFDLIISNPPYICEHDPHLTQGDVRFEPNLALTSGANGLTAIGTIVSGAPRYLRPQGWLMLEHGYNQANEVRTMMHKAHFINIRSHLDLAGVERTTIGQFNPDSAVESQKSRFNGSSQHE